MATAFRSFIAVGRQYQGSPTDENMEQVLRQLDVLMGQTSSASDLRIFDPRDLVIAESLTFMVELLLESKPQIVKKLFFFLQNLGRSPRLQESLCCQFHLHSSLAVFLQTYGTPEKDPIVIQCLNLLEVYTYHAIIPYVENSMEFVLKVVFKEIQNNFSDVLIPCMGILSNLSRNSPAVVSYIKSLPGANRILKTLTEKLSCNLQPVFLHAMLSLSALLKGDPIRDGFFNDMNTCQALEVAVKVFSTEELSTQRTAADLLRVLLTCPSCLKHILESNQLENTMSTFWKVLVNTKSLYNASNLLHLLVSLFSCSTLKTAIFNSLQVLPAEGFHDILVCLREWGVGKQAQDPVHQANVYAWQILNVILQEICLNEQLSQHKSFLVTTLNLVLPKHLKADIHFELPDLKLQLQKVSNILEFLLVLSQHDQIDILLSGLKPELCRHVIIRQIESHSLISDPDCVNTSLNIVLLMLSIMKNLIEGSNQIKDLFMEALKSKDVMPFLAGSLLSKTPIQVQRTLEIISCASNSSSFSADILGESIAAQNVLNKTSNPSESFSMAPATDSPIKESPRRKSRQSLDNSVQALISKLESGLEIKDLQSSEIMDMYENKVDVLTRQTQELQKVLEAKTAALQQSDKLLTHYRCVQAQHDAEAIKLRNILKDSEKKSELAREQTKEVVNTRQKMAAELNQCKHRVQVLQHEYEELNESKQEVCQTLKTAKQQVEELQSNSDSLKEMNAVLTKQVDNIQQKHEAMSLVLQEATNENRGLAKQVKEKDHKLKELSSSLNLCMEDLKSAEENLSILDKTNTQLKEALVVSEKKEAELRLEVTSLRKLCSQHEASFLEKTHEIHIINEQLADQKKITDGIMNLLKQQSR